MEGGQIFNSENLIGRLNKQLIIGGRKYTKPQLLLIPTADYCCWHGFVVMEGRG